MSVARVLRLDEYRDRRHDRLRLARAFYGADRCRETLVGYLAEIADITRADRVGAVWVDEYGPGLVHPHTVLDLSRDRPRRSFAVEPLHRAWEFGVPGAYDQAMEREPTTPSTFAVALGSDGSRAWFVTAESVSPREALDGPLRDRLMFLAGECSALVLHRDLDTPEGRARGTTTAADPAGARFAGWQILRDIEGRESNEEQSRRIAQRFVVGRLARMLVDEDMTLPPDQVSEHVRRARAELSRHDAAAGDEAELWHETLDAYEQSDMEWLGRALLAAAGAAERAYHHYGALELYRCAFEIAAAIGSPGTAVDAARMSGRLLRRRARWDDANQWYRVAHGIAEIASLHDLAARALAGLATIKQAIGNIPEARDGLQRAKQVAEMSGDRDTLASIYDNLRSLEQAAGNLTDGLGHGWKAVVTCASDDEKTRCLAGLAGALQEYGDREAAEHAWALVAHTSHDQYYRTWAHDALGHLAALRGDLDGFIEHAARCDELGWEATPLAAQAQILYYRGLSYQALGQLGNAERWLRRTVAFAEEHSFNQWLFTAEEALVDLRQAVAREEIPPPAAPPDVRDGLRAMRQELTGVVA